MQKIVVFLVLWTVLTPWQVFAQGDSSVLFARGVAAYDAGDLEGAIAVFGELAAGAGGRNVEVLYNLGNAYYRNGDVGRAIWAYRSAQRLAPRDADVAANLRFAAQTAGIALPDDGFWAARVGLLSAAEWRVLFRAGYIGLFLLLVLGVFPGRFRLTCHLLAGVALLVALAAGAALWADSRHAAQPEWVVLAPGVQADSAPLGAGTEIARLPAGTICRQRDQRADWLEIQSGEVRAWIPKSTAMAVR